MRKEEEEEWGPEEGGGGSAGGSGDARMLQSCFRRLFVQRFDFERHTVVRFLHKLKIRCYKGKEDCKDKKERDFRVRSNASIHQSIAT